MLRTLSLAEWEIRSVFSCTAAFCGATHSAVDHREEGVQAFRQQRVRENCFYAFGSVRKLSGPIAEAYHLLIALAFSRSFRPALYLVWLMQGFPWLACMGENDIYNWSKPN